jgi:adenylate cyclase
MAEDRAQRRLAAILAADVVGYSRLIGRDEAGTLAALKSIRTKLIDPKIAEHSGRVFKTTGDGLLAEFPSVVNAVACANDIQRDMAERNRDKPQTNSIQLRIGINLGDVVIEGGDVFGDGVNVAARIESLAPPGGIVLTETVRDHLGSRLDIQFVDLGEQRLKNIDQPIRAYKVQGVGDTSLPQSVAPQSRTERPSIAVLPFTNMSGDPEQEYFSDGITEDIITELSRFRSLLVIARNSSFTYKGKAETVQQVGRELGVEYVLEGSVRKLGNRVRITAQFVDAKTGAHIWAERLDRGVDDLFAMQDEVTERIVATIAHRLERTEQERAAGKRPETMRPYDYILRARAIVSDTAEANRQSRALYEKALVHEPTSILALTGLAWSYLIDRIDRRWDGPGDALERAHALGRQALALDSTDYRVHLLLGYILEHQGQFTEALLHFEQALALNANDADGAAHMGNLQIGMGRFEEALEWFKRAARLNPFHPAWYLYGIGLAHYGARQYEQAIAPLRMAVSRFPTFITPRRHLAATYAQMGRMEEARAEIEVLRKLDPSLSIASYRERMRYEKVEDQEHYLDGLRKAGLPE